MTTPPPNPLATPEPWDTVSPAYTDELLPLFEQFSRDALDRADLPANAQVADIAAGPGTLSIKAAKQGAHILAVDFSHSMVMRHRVRAQAAGVSHRICILEGDAMALLPAFEADAFDAVFSMFGLIFFPDRIAGFRELRRILKAGRKAIVASWAPFEGPYGLLMDVVRANLPGMPFGQGQAPLGHPDDYHREMKAAGFSRIIVDTILHTQPAPSAEEFWKSVQRTNVGVILARRRVGEDAWAKLSDSVLGQLLKEALGPGPVAVSARGHLGIGIKSQGS